MSGYENVLPARSKVIDPSSGDIVVDQKLALVRPALRVSGGFGMPSLFARFVCVFVLQQFRSRRWCTPPRHSAICETRQSDQRNKNKNTVRLLVDLLCVAPIHSCSAGVCTPTGEQIRKWKPWKFSFLFSFPARQIDLTQALSQGEKLVLVLVFLLFFFLVPIEIKSEMNQKKKNLDPKMASHWGVRINDADHCWLVLLDVEK